MPDHDYLPVSPDQILPPAHNALSAAMPQLGVGSALSPWERHKLERQSARSEMQRLQDAERARTDTLVAVNRVVMGGQLAAAGEYARVVHHDSSQDCLLRAAGKLDEALHEAGGLSENTRALFQGAMFRTSEGYVKGVVRRMGQAA